MYKVIFSNRFEKDVSRCLKRGLDGKKLYEIIELLRLKGSLPVNYKPHKLKGKYSNCWECHIQPDWLLVWQQNDKELILLFTNTGTHSDLFK